MNRKRAACHFFLRRGAAILEVLIALSMLTIVLLVTVLVRLTLIRQDSGFIAELSGAAIIRQAAMDFQAGALTNGISDEYTVETGEKGSLSGIISTNNNLRISQITLDFSSSSADGSERVSFYSARNRLLPLWHEEGRTRPPPVEPILSSSPSLFTLDVTTADEAKGTAAGTTNDLVYGILAPISAEKIGDAVFQQWIGDIETITDIYSSDTTIYMDEDKEIAALFY